MYSVVVVNMDASFGKSGMMRKVICMPCLVDGTKMAFVAYTKISK